MNHGGGMSLAIFLRRTMAYSLELQLAAILIKTNHLALIVRTLSSQNLTIRIKVNNLGELTMKYSMMTAL